MCRWLYSWNSNAGSEISVLKWINISVISKLYTGLYCLSFSRITHSKKSYICGYSPPPAPTPHHLHPPPTYELLSFLGKCRKHKPLIYKGRRGSTNVHSRYKTAINLHFPYWNPGMNWDLLIAKLSSHNKTQSCKKKIG